MPTWTEDQARRIQRGWQRNTTQMWLSMGCPNCGHESAFRHLSVSAISVTVGGGVATDPVLSGQSFFDEIKADFRAVFGKHPSIPLAFPEHYMVSCGCKNVVHEPHSGCGAEGVIETAELS